MAEECERSGPRSRRGLGPRSRESLVLRGRRLWGRGASVFWDRFARFLVFLNYQ